LSMKLADDLGVGLGFFPPDTASLNQFGNRDGTVDTENGPRPSPLRMLRAHQNASYFSLLGAVGYRVSDWIRVGVGLQWQLVVFEGRSLLPAIGFSGLGPRGDVRTEVFGRDLFVPGVIGSVHFKPLDALDIAVGFKWSDRIQAKGKIDVTTAANGLGEPFEYIDGNTQMLTATGTTLPSQGPNQRIEVNAPPIWAPQLSFGIRYADRLQPLVHDGDWRAAKLAAPQGPEDSMQTERWDIELDLIYYMTSVHDRTDVRLKDVAVAFRTINAQGTVDPPFTVLVGDCVKPNRPLGAGEACEVQRARIEINGQDQITLRLGGDYNILPGLLSVRGGASYETDGQAPSWMSPFQYMAGRIGLHAGLTVRVARKTDISVGFAHFFQKAVRLQLHPERIGEYYSRYRADPERYHIALGEHDGTAAIEVPNGGRPLPGPYFVNAGSYYYDLSVLSASIARHF